MIASTLCAWLLKTLKWVVLAALCTVTAVAQINPATGIRWPAGCQIYNVATGLCVSAVGGGIPSTGGIFTGPVAMGLGAISYPQCSGVDDTAYLNGLLATYKQIDFSGQSCVASNLVNGVSGLVMRGAGKITQKAGSTNCLFSDNGLQFDMSNLELYGGNDISHLSSTPGITPANTRSAICLTTQIPSHMHYVKIHGFDAWAITQIDTSRNPDNQTFSANDGDIYNNYGALQLGPNFSEYTRFSNMDINNNYMGAYIASGNILITGSKFVDNAYNVYLLGTGIPNNAHGSVTGSELNHAGIDTIYAENVTNGFSFSGDQIFQGIVWLNQSTGISIVGGELDATAYNLEGGGANAIVNNFMNMGYANTVNHAYLGFPDETIFFGNYLASGAPWGQPSAYSTVTPTCQVGSGYTMTASLSVHPINVLVTMTTLGACSTAYGVVVPLPITVDSNWGAIACYNQSTSAGGTGFFLNTNLYIFNSAGVNLFTASGQKVVCGPPTIQ